MKFVLILGLIVFQSSCARPNPENMIVQEELLKIQEGLKRFYRDTGRYPTEMEQLIVLTDHSSIKGWNGPYISSQELFDPWQKAYRYGKIRDIIFIASSGRNGLPETTQLDLNQGLSRGDDIIIMMPEREF